MRTLAAQMAAMQQAQNQRAQMFRAQNANRRISDPAILNGMRNAARDCEYCGTKRFQTEDCRNCGAPA